MILECIVGIACGVLSSILATIIIRAYDRHEKNRQG